MDHYVEIKVLPDPEFGEIDLLNALFSKLHRHLGKIVDGRVGVSFPRYGHVLGNCLRLHGKKEDLLKLMESDFLKGMRDYTSSTTVIPIPEIAGYRTVKRVQSKSAHNKRRRSIAKGWLSEADAFERIPDSQQKTIKLPYAELKSLSNGNRMRVYVEHGSLQSTAVEGSFNAYGLSAYTTIPWF